MNINNLSININKKTILAIIIFLTIIITSSIYIMWQLAKIKSTTSNIKTTNQSIKEKKIEIKALQGKITYMLATKKNYINTVNRLNNVLKTHQGNIESYGIYTLPVLKSFNKNIKYLQSDIKDNISNLNITNINIKLEINKSLNDILVTVIAFGSLDSFYKLGLRILQLEYVSSIQSLLLEEIASSRMLTLKFWVQYND